MIAQTARNSSAPLRGANPVAGACMRVELPFPWRQTGPMGRAVTHRQGLHLQGVLPERKRLPEHDSPPGGVVVTASLAEMTRPCCKIPSGRKKAGVPTAATQRSTQRAGQELASRLRSECSALRIGLHGEHAEKALDARDERRTRDGGGEQTVSLESPLIDIQQWCDGLDGGAHGCASGRIVREIAGQADVDSHHDRGFLFLSTVERIMPVHRVAGACISFMLDSGLRVAR